MLVSVILVSSYCHPKNVCPPSLCVGICEDGQIRLSGGSTVMEGRVEICFNETWGTICDNFWTSNDGNVVCNELGFSRFGR